MLYLKQWNVGVTNILVALYCKCANIFFQKCIFYINTDGKICN